MKVQIYEKLRMTIEEKIGPDSDVAKHQNNTTVQLG
jgi:hypothetical protein